MRLEPLCDLDLHYIGDFHLARPYGGESGTGWGRGEGVAHGDRLSGAITWSNHPTRRGDGAMLPNARGVISTENGAEILVDLTGRTVWVERDGQEVGRQLLVVLMESEHDGYSWLNNLVCVGEGLVDPEAMTSHIQVFSCVPEA
jgi:hypothetical protein